MKKFKLLDLFIFLSASVFLSLFAYATILSNKSSETTHADPITFVPQTDPVPSHVVLNFKEGTTKEEIKDYVEAIGGEITSEIENLDSVVINIEGDTEINNLPKNDKLAVSEPDYYISALGDEVNDPEYSKQWNLDVLGVQDAWTETADSTNSVVVAVVDSGICLDHSDLQNKIANGWDFIENDAVPQDDFGHGCEISGIIAANTNNNTGIAGISNNIKVMPIRVLDGNGSGTYSDLAAGIVYAVDNGAQVINLSLGGINTSTILENAINYAINKGVIVVAAAGNTGKDGVLYPAKYEGVIAVGSVDQDLQRSSFSTYGTEVKIMAPGRDIYTTSKDGNYTYVSGTSFAAPQVAGMEAYKFINNKEYQLDGKVLSWSGNKEYTNQNTNSNETIISNTSDIIQSAGISIEGAVVVGNPCNLRSDYSNSSRNHRSDGWDSAGKAVDFTQSSDCTNNSLIASISGTVTTRTETVQCDISGKTGTQTNTVLEIDNGKGVKVSYRHQSSSISGGFVNKGDIIGTIGSIGCSLGSHIHFEVYLSNSKQSYDKWALDLADLRTDNNIILYENANYSGLGYVKQPTTTYPVINSVPSYLDNAISSVWIGKNLCTYAYGSPRDDLTPPSSSTTYDDLQWSLISPWIHINSSFGSLAGLNWHREGQTTGDYLSSKVDNDISTYVTGRPCTTNATSLGTMSIIGLGTSCFSGPSGSSSGGGTTTPPAPSDTVKLYGGSEYGSTLWISTANSTNEPSRNTLYKSMYVPSGWSVKLWDQDNYTGNVQCWSQSEPLLQSKGWHDRIESMQIYQYNACPTENNGSWVKICNTTGSWTSHPGNCRDVPYDIPDLGKSGFGNDVLKAISFQGNWAAVLFEHENYQGRSVYLSDNYDDLGGIAIGYGASSILVRKKTDAHMTLFSLGDLNGERFISDRNIADLGPWGFNDKAQSVTVDGGYEAIFCTDAGYKGICGKATSDHKDINEVAYGLRDNVSSFMVCKGTCLPAPVLSVVNAPAEGTYYSPGSVINFSWGGNGDEYNIEIYGGDLTSTIKLSVNTAGFNKSDLPASSKPYYLRVQGWSPYGYGGWTDARKFYVQDIAPTNVNINGPASGIISENVNLSALVGPYDANNIQYTWTPEPKSGQGTANVTYNWNVGGIKTISVSAVNSGGSATNTSQITIACESGKYEASYYNNTYLEGDVMLSQCEDEINHDWGSEGPIDTTLPDLTINSGTTYYVDDIRTKVTATANADSTEISVANISGFAKHDEIIIISMIGNNTGVYEYATLDDVTDKLVLWGQLQNTYPVSASDKVQVIKVQKFKDMTVNGFLTSHPWDGETGGIVAINVTGNLTVNGTIDVTAKGYRGGERRTENNPDRGNTGEGYPGNYNANTIDCWGNENYNGNGGGSGHGYVYVWDSNKHSAGGAGGGNKTNGGYGAAPSFDGWCVGSGGRPVGDDTLTKMYMGGGGGSGGAGQNGDNDGGAGGDGGGLIFIEAKNINVTGDLVSNGSVGEAASGNDWHLAGGGGGGAGGSILVKAKSVNIRDNGIITNGGAGGAPASLGSGGGAGGIGRARIDYCDTISGTATAVTAINKVSCSYDHFSASWTRKQTFTAGDYTFTLKADDGARLYIDDQIVIDKWVGGYNETQKDITLAAGEHKIYLEYYEQTGDAKVSLNITKPLTVKAEYFNNTELSGTPAVTRMEESIDHTWGWDSPVEGITEQGYSGRFTKTITIDETGEYTFIMDINDGVRAFVDGTKVIDIWIYQPGGEFREKVNLTAGKHTVVVEFFNWGDGGMTLEIKKGNFLYAQDDCSKKTTGQYCVQYYNNTNVTGVPAAIKIDNTINHDWKDATPENNVRPDYFSASFTGNVNFEAGNYKFSGLGDDVIKVWVDNVVIIDQSAYTTTATVVQKFLTAGIHEIKVNYVDFTDKAVVNLTWEKLPNTQPTVKPIPSQTINEDGKFTTFDLDNYVTDPDTANGDKITWTAKATLSTTQVALDSGNVVTITVPKDWNGNDVVTFTATDLTGGTNTTQLALKANAVNDAPIITSTAGTQAFVNKVYSYDVNATDVDNPTLVYSVTGITGMTINSSTGLISWTPATAEIGTKSAVVTVSDGILTATQNFAITAAYDPADILSIVDDHMDNISSWTPNAATGFTINAENSALKVYTTLNSNAKKELESKWISIQGGKTYYLAGRMQVGTADTPNMLVKLYDANYVYISTVKTVSGKSGTVNMTQYSASFTISATVNKKTVKFAKIVLQAGDKSTKSASGASTWFDDIYFALNPRPAASFTYSPTTNIVEGNTVTLNGTKSTATGNKIYKWTQTAGPTVVLSSNSVASPTFVTPDANAAYTLSFQLEVSDGVTWSFPVSQTITVIGMMNTLNEDFATIGTWTKSGSDFSTAIDNGALKVYSSKTKKTSNITSDYFKVENVGYNLVYKVKTQTISKLNIKITGYSSSFSSVVTKTCTAANVSPTKDWQTITCSFTDFKSKTSVKFTKVSIQYETGSNKSSSIWIDSMILTKQ